MNRLGRWLFGENGATPGPRPFLVTCKCGSQDFTRVCSIVGVSIDLERNVSSYERGAVLSCQRCPRVFAVGPDGAFDRDPRSLPPIMQLPERDEGPQHRGPTPDEALAHRNPIRPRMPEPRERPKP
jgi:hypothetical protein